jgi:hypothetical protein
MSVEQTELRAERLRVAIQLLDISADVDAGLYSEPRPLLPKPDLALARTISFLDRVLAQACLAVDRDMRRREWEGLEGALVAIPPGGDLGSVYDLPADQALPALHAAHACGWLQEAGG